MFWDDLPPGDRDAIEGIALERRYPDDALVFFESEASDYSLIVTSGLLKLTRTSQAGREALIELRGPGELIGEVAVINGSPRTASAVTLSEVRALALPGDRFREILRQRPGLCYAVLANVAGKLGQTADRRLEAVAGDALARLCGRLLELADRSNHQAGGSFTLELPVTQQELADWLGLSRDAVVLAFRRLRELGWVETSRQQVRILDVDALRRAIAA